MLLTLAIIALSTAGGLALTYLYEKNDSLLARIAAGNVIGAAILAVFGFLFASAVGLSVPIILLAVAIAASPVLLLRRKDIHKEFRHDLDKAKGKTQGATPAKAIRFAYYVGVMLILGFFFERAMIETDQGIFTGGSQNLGDLPFHLGAIFAFSEGNNFPPENPSYAGAKFTYPFFADMLTAFFVKLGAGVREAMFVQNLTLGFSLIVLLEKFVTETVGIREAGKIAVLLLIFSGGLGFVWFAKDYVDGAQGLAATLWKLPQDYTIGEKFRWGNSLVVLFLTQRSLLFGMPVTLIALTALWRIFSVPAASDEEADHGAPAAVSYLPHLLVGFIAGTLPLIHVHSLAVLFVVSAYVFFTRRDRWRELVAFGIGVSVISLPMLAWSLTGSASNLKEFIGWHIGWDSKDQNLLAFWIKNLGIFIPLSIAGGILLSKRDKESDSRLVLFYLPFAFLFLVSNTVKLAPWEWDNIKVLIYWFVGSLPFVAYSIAWAWERGGAMRVVAIGAFLILTMSGALDVWRTVSGQINYSVFSHDAVKIANEIRQRTDPKALFLNAPTYNSAVVISGRRSLMRYSGHLGSYGIDYSAREADVKRIYSGSAIADALLKKYEIDYVIISPEEIGNIMVSREYFEKFQTVAEYGDYRVVKAR